MSDYREEWRRICSDFDIFAHNFRENAEQAVRSNNSNAEARLAVEAVWELGLVVKKVVKQAAAIEAMLRAVDEDAYKYLDAHRVNIDDASDLRRQHEDLTAPQRRALFFLRRWGRASPLGGDLSSWSVWSDGSTFYSFSHEDGAALVEKGYARVDIRDVDMRFETGAESGRTKVRQLVPIFPGEEG